MDVFLSNTLTKKKERFAPADPTRVTMYVCGPTVYDYAHIGNYRPAVTFDVLFRLLRLLYGADHVVYARNFTDIDDRIIARAAAAGEDIATYTERYAQAYLQDSAALNVLRPTKEPRATQYVDGMIDVISRLIACGCAYPVRTGVYFCVAADADYGKLSGRIQDDLLAGARIEGEDDKKSPSDFALWKAAKPGEPAWEAPFGVGRPGWHIECSAMIAAELGATIDIHAGGLDLIFPHHENEIAQSESAFGAPLARYWLHNGFLDLEGEKMSKSLGNVRLVNELLRDWPGEAIRWALLSGHYKAPLNFSRDLLEQATASLDRLYGALERLQDAPDQPGDPPPGLLAALCDDLNTPKAMAELFALAGQEATTKTPQERAALKAALKAGGDLIGLLQQAPAAWFQGEGDDAAEIEALVAARAEARASKNWAEADRLRAVLAQKGIEVLDGAGGSRWRRAGKAEED
jgi:cysteinyl-tRNA synthetase